MGKFNHILKPILKACWPRNWIYVDTEADIHDTDEGGQLHTLKVGVANYVRDGKDTKHKTNRWHTFTEPGDFWRWAVSQAEPDHRLVIFGYNMAYDIRILDGFHVLAGLGYTQDAIYVAQGVTILCWRKDGFKIQVIDAMNYLDGSLAKWGKLFGMPKGEIDFRTATVADLIPYCKQDVRILRKAVESWRGFVRRHKLGCFCLTRSAQALCGFRHRFMKHKIWIHARPDAIALERAGYHGGRTECLHIGKVPGGPFTVVDVNSQYPSVMVTTPVPVKLRTVLTTPNLADLPNLLLHHCLMAEVTLKTDVPAYPLRAYKRQIVRSNGVCRIDASKPPGGPATLLWPIGTYQTTLATPELALAVASGHVMAVHRVAVYKRAIIFRDYVRTLYPIRQAYKAKGNDVFATMCKVLLNSLYGKFGQRSETWKTTDNRLNDRDGRHVTFDLDKGRFQPYAVLAGQRWDIEPRGESIHSFPAIAAHITSAARMLLWRLILQAGMNHVFYMDTDSLFVDRVGLRRLRAEMHPTDLGRLGIKEKTKTLTVHAPKDYTTDTETRRKGIKADAVRTADGGWSQMQWVGLLGSISTGELGQVRLKPVVKHLARIYDKGIVHHSGAVSPLVFAAD